MATNTARVEDIKGLSPAVDLTRTPNTYAIRGKNYVFDAIGPRSIFGSRFLCEASLSSPSHVQGFKISVDGLIRCFTITNLAIMEWSEALGAWKYLYLIPDTSATPYRWTWGYLNGFIFFCHPRVGLLDMDIESGKIFPTKGEGIPPAPIAISVDSGRLGILTDKFLYWSAQSDGKAFTPKLGGAGAQLVNDRVSGDPITLTAYGKGFLTWTTDGVMQSDFVGDQAVYRHVNISTEYKPVNSFCVVRISDGESVILDERGLFQVRGNQITPFAPLFNEFLIDYIASHRLKFGQNCRLEWDNLRRHLYVMVSSTQNESKYEKAFVLYPTIDKWGEFTRDHFGLLPIVISGSLREGEYFGCVGTDGIVRYFIETGSGQVVSTATNLTFVQRASDFEAFEVESSGGVICAAGRMVMSTTNPFVKVSESGYYEPNSPTIVTPSVEGLNASVVIGPFRGLSDAAPDQLTEIHQLLLRTGKTGDYGDAMTNFDLVAPEGFDFGSVSTPVDNGFEKLNYTNHKLKVISTLDAENEFQSAIPELVGFTPAARFFACSTVGLWHLVEFSATEVGEAFKVSTLELQAANAGVLN